MTVKETIGWDGRGNAIGEVGARRRLVPIQERWGPSSGMLRALARPRKTSQETPLVFPAGETTDTDALAHAHPGGLLAAPILAKGGQSSWKGTRRRAMERDEREGAPLDVCYLPVLRAAEAPTGQSVYRQRSCP
ncbi:unnamed protein product [Lasius platythorax]|uniref:Uncharacterized protein n=1 Tax=Lasius platythorax TaxID=488582 RepID=A0AAV2NQ95_9HYME